MELVCIVCPNGCVLQAENTPDGVQVTGNKCKRGIAFAIEELTAPKRSLTTTVATRSRIRRAASRTCSKSRRESPDSNEEALSFIVRRF